MAESDLVGSAMTVTGPVSPAALGRTLTHEHFLLDMNHYWVEPEAVTERQHAMEPVRLDNRWWVTANLYQSKDALSLDELDTAIEEAELFRREGGGTIVDVSTVGLGRDPRALRSIAQESGVNVVAAAGYYVDDSHPDDMDEKSVDDITDEIVSDVTEGIADTNVRAGIIGELGTSDPITENERKVLQAGARAQRLTGAPITIHTYPLKPKNNAMEILDVLEDAGADLERVVLGHVDSAPPTGELVEHHMALADRGAYVQYDGFGITRYSSVNDWEYPRDGERIDAAIELIEAGYIDQLLFSHDVCAKTYWTKYGGRGYGHILREVVPRFRGRGLDDEQIETLLVGNPGRMLSLVEPTA